MKKDEIMPQSLQRRGLYFFASACALPSFEGESGGGDTLGHHLLFRSPLSLHTDDFILKVSVPKVTEKLIENREGVTEKLIENVDRLIEKLIEKSIENGERLTENRIAILRLIAENPYISKSDLAKSICISVTAISGNRKTMRDKYLRRVGPDKGGFWEIIE